MKRQATAYLKIWKESTNRKRLIIQGTRQVGKTWLMKEFGKNNYERTAYVNFENSIILKKLFIEDFNIPRILSAIEIESDTKISPQNTLIILDEIQEAERGITALKYFCENAPQYHVIAAGSLLGVSLHSNTSFPVGKVNFLNLYPLNFPEFLEATENSRLLELLKKRDWNLIKLFKNKYIQLLKQYYFTGGMPEVVYEFIQNNDLKEVRDIQKRILLGYERDFSKYAPGTIVPRIRMLWNSIPSQLSKENKKFIYSAVKKSARARDFEFAISWLSDSGLVYKVHRITKPGLPLKAYEDFSSFKLFISDVGLLAAMSNLPARSMIEGNSIFEEFKGALTEQYVLQQLRTLTDDDIFYWSADRSRAEIDFIVQDEQIILPIEVKAEENLMAKSLKTFYQKYTETKPVRVSMSDFRQESWLTNIPLYAISELFN